MVSDQVQVAAGAGAALGDSNVVLTGTGCTSTDCGQAFRLQVPVTVVAAAVPPGTLASFAQPSPDRVAATVDHELQDELLVMVGTTDAPGTRDQAQAAAQSADGFIPGGLEDMGIYQVRWSSPQDLAALKATLQAQPGVSGVSLSLAGLQGEASANHVAPTLDLPQWTWPLTQVHAQ